jgi:anti-anti-sigma factor
MKARIKTQASSIVLYLDGKVDYETQDEVCQFISKTIAKNKTDQTPKNIIVNLQNLEFVGSTGITQFVQQLKNIHQESKVLPQYCGVRSEFQKIIKAFDEDDQFRFIEN